MRGSCSESAAELDLSRRVQTVSQIERADRAGARVREVGEPPVAAHPLLAPRSLVRLLDAERAARERFAGQFQHPIALGPLRLVEELRVDLGGEHLLRAAHVADAAERVVVDVQARAPGRDTCGGGDHPIAVRQALAALGGLGAAGGPAHPGRVYSRRVSGRRVSSSQYTVIWSPVLDRYAGMVSRRLVV